MELNRKEPDAYEQVPLWTFSNHPNPAVVLDKNREYDVADDYWHRDILERMREDWLAIGLDVPVSQMFFSGFCSQGDGACFDACTIDWVTFWPQLKGTYYFLSRFKQHLPQPTLYHTGRYNHELSVVISLDDTYGYAETAMADDALQQRFPGLPTFSQLGYTATCGLWNDLTARYTPRFCNELDELESELIDLLREKMRELYAALEEEHDYLTSNDLLMERFTDTGFLFAEDGTIHYV